MASVPEQHIDSVVYRDGVKYEMEVVKPSALVVNEHTGLVESIDSPMVSQKQAKNMVPIAAAERYDYDEENEEDALHPEYRDMTTYEVMTRRQAQRAAKGDRAAVDYIQGYMLGRPKQQTEIKSVSVDYISLLKHLGGEAPVVTVDNLKEVFG